MVDNGSCASPDRDYRIARLTDGTRYRDSFEYRAGRTAEPALHRAGPVPIS